MLSEQHLIAEFGNSRLTYKIFSGSAPRPCIAEPDCRKDMKRRGFRTAIRRCNPNENVVWTSLRVFHNDIEVPLFIKYARVGDFEFGILLSASAVVLNKSGVRKFGVGIFV